MEKYCPAECPCLNTGCDLYQNCEACEARHHASVKYPMTACEICVKEQCEQANPVEYFRQK